MKQKLTKRTIDALQKAEKEYRLFDSEIPGFHVRVKPTGVKSFAIKYRSSGRQRNYTIGRYGTLTPDQARKKAREQVYAIDTGSDPSTVRRKERSGLSLEDLWNKYLERHAIPHKAPNSLREDRSLWRTHIKPKWSQHQLSSIRYSEMQRWHSALADRPYAANRALCLLSKMFNLAIEWGDAEANPVKSIKKFHETPRERFLTGDERARLSQALAKEADTAGAIAIWMCILTGARRSEVLEARWNHFDIDSDRPVWTIPAASTKQARSNRKPLSNRAQAILLEWREFCPVSEARWLIPGRDPAKRRSDLNGPWRRIQKAAHLQDVRLHDLRHDFASSAIAEGWSLEIIGRYLGHRSIQTTQRYAHLQDDPLQAMADQIGRSYAK